MIFSRLRMASVAAVSAATAVCVFAVGANASAISPAPRSHASPVTSVKPQGRIKAPVTGTFRTSHGIGHFTGKFMPRHFKVVRGVLKATGKLTGTMTGPGGKHLGTVTRTITTTVETKSAKDAATPAACSVLNLVLGPLHLNLLGLNVNLNRVHLTITAIPGAGQLIGNLLCAIANLLNSGGSLGQLSSLLNQVLALI